MLVQKEDFVGNLARLRTLLDPQKLPAELPLRDGHDSKYAMFLNFELDPDVLEKTEGEVATVSEQFKGAFGWQTRSSGDGIIRLEERGQGLLAAVDVLERFHGKFPGDAVLQKWAYDLGAAAEHAYVTHSKPLPTATTGTAQKRRRASSSAIQLTLDGLHVDSDTQSDNTRTASKGRASKGRPPNDLMNKAITKGLDTSENKTTAYWTCVSPACTYQARGNPSQVRVFKHASTCTSLRVSHPDIYHAIVRTQSTASLGAQINGDLQSDPDDIPNGSAKSIDEPRAAQVVPSQKKLRIEGKIDGYVRKGGRERKHEERALLQKNVDHMIVRLICSRGLVPSILDSDEWRGMMRLLNPDYSPPPSDKFTKDYIPKEAAYVRTKQLEALHEHDNLTITFDGNSTRRDSVYFVHATTPERAHYFIDGHVGTDAHHTVPWVKSKVMQSIEDVGIHRTAAVCSDSTIVTLNTRSDIARDIPTIFDLRDCCHQLHNTIADITRLSAFKESIGDMKKIIAHFSKSTFGRAMLQKSTVDGGKLLALQKVGKTRFGSYWSAAQSLLPALPRIRELVQSKEIKFRHKHVQALFVNRISTEYTRLERALVQYTAIVEPLVRSLWALEASSANASDVFVFFTACAASLKELFSFGPEETGISADVAAQVIDIYNDRYDEFFFHSEIYFAAFALDPRYPVSDYLLISPTAQPSITVPRSGANLALPHPRAYDRMKEFVKKALKDIFDRKRSHLNEPIDPILEELGANEASKRLKTQLEAYWMKEVPFHEEVKLCPSKSTLSYWTGMRAVSGAQVLAVVCIKIFSVLVNSMPDERTGSKFTWFNSPLRGNQHAQTLVDMVQVGQYYSRLAAKAEGDSAGGTSPEHRKVQPTVRFRDIHKDLLEMVQQREEEEEEAESEDHNPLDEDPDDTLPQFLQSRQQVMAANGTVSSGADSARSSAATPSPVLSGKELLPTSIVNLRSPALLDLLSDTPRIIAPASADPSSSMDPQRDVFEDF